jgi:hypothetical protein
VAHTHNIHNVVKCVHSIYHCCSGEVALHSHIVEKRLQAENVVETLAISTIYKLEAKQPK